MVSFPMPETGKVQNSADGRSRHRGWGGPHGSRRLPQCPIVWWIAARRIVRFASGLRQVSSSDFRQIYVNLYWPEVREDFPPRRKRFGSDNNSNYYSMVVYELPFGTGRAMNPANVVARALASGWRLSSITQQFRIIERIKLDFSAEGFNLANAVIFSGPMRTGTRLMRVRLDRSYTERSAFFVTEGL